MKPLREERRTLQEQLGSDFNASHLEVRARQEMPIERIAAMGAAQLHIHHGADYRREPIATVLGNKAHEADPQDVIAAELASTISHIRDGRQHDLVPRAVDLFAKYISYRDRVRRLDDAAILIPKLAARALHEFLSDRCLRCGGTGRLEQLGDGSLVRGTGRGARNAIFRNCPVKQGCGGTGRAIASSTQRRIALDLSVERYDKERWDAIVRAAIVWLQRMQHRMKGPLTVQLERSKKRV